MPRSAEVDSLLDRLAHPRRAEIDLLRGTLLAAVPGVVEMVKWNSPSFGAPEPFATLHLRDPKAILVILHRGARPTGAAVDRGAIPDPTSLLTWKGNDRAIARFGDAATITARRTALTKIVRAWVRSVQR